MIRHLVDAVQRDESIATLFTDAVAEAKEVARAEIDLQKVRLLAKVGEAQSAVGLLVGALVCASLALTGLVVGALLILQRIVGPGWATLIVVGTLLLLAGMLGWLALGRFRAMFAAPAAAR